MKQLPKDRYIYTVTHRPTGLVYVGKRFSSTVKSVEDDYWGSGVEIKELLRNHPIEEFDKEILEKGINDPESLNDAEDMWIDIFRNEFGRYEEGGLCLNIADGGEGGIRMLGDDNPMFGRKRPDTAEFNRQTKTIGVIDLDSRETWATELECANYLGVTKGAISRAVRGINKATGRRLALNTPQGIQRIQSTTFYKPGEKNSDRLQKPIGVVGTNICFASLKDAADFIGRSAGGITNAIKRNGECAGVRFEYISIDVYRRREKFQQIHLENILINTTRGATSSQWKGGGNRRKSVQTKDGSLYFSSVTEAANHLNIGKSAITLSIKHGRPCKGVLLEYGDEVQSVGKEITVQGKTISYN